MKKLQMITLLILSLFLMFSCVPEDEEEEEFLNDEQTDTIPDGNSGVDTDSAADTLPDGEQDSGTDSSDTIPDNSDSTQDPADSDVSDSDTGDTGKTDSEPANDGDTEVVETDNDADEPISDDDTVPAADNDTDLSDDSDLTDDDVEPTTDNDNESTTDNDSEPSTGIPECSDADITPCKDSSSGYIWSKKSSNVTLSKAESNCQSLTEGGLSGWRLPTIGELRTLIKNCASTQQYGSCLISDDCLANTDECTAGCSSCASDSSGKYSKLGDTETLWSSSGLADNFYFVWTINFHSANFSYASNVSDKYAARCIKK